MKRPFEHLILIFSPDNNHPMPIAESWDGSKWTVDLQVRTADGLDIDGTGISESLDEARTKAFQRLKKSRTLFLKFGYVTN